MNFLKKLFLPVTAPIEFVQNNFKTVLLIVIVIILAIPKEKDLTHVVNLQKINLSGPIMEPSEVLKQIETATNNKNIKGVLFIVDSPGGSVAPSVEISYAIKRLREKKPVVAYAKGIMASGSYYSSIWANSIVANPGSMIGSIGVILEGVNINELMKKIGVQTQIIQAGKYKQVATPTRAWKNYEVDELNKVIQDTYNMFVGDVAKARKLNIEDKHIFADAHIFTASQAKKAGLIDKVGVIYDAKKQLIKLSGVKKPIWNQEDKFDKIMKKLTAMSSVVLYTYFPSITLK